MKWIKIKDRHDLPRDGYQFFARWKDIICLAQFDKEEGRFYICFNPADYFTMRVEQDRECKFTHWMPCKKEYETVTSEQRGISITFRGE